MLTGFETSLFQCQAHGFGSAATLGVRGGVVVGIAGVAITADLGVELGTAFLCKFLALKDKDARTFAEHEAVATAVEGQGGCHGVFGSGEGFHVVEAADCHLADRCFGTAGDDGVGTTLTDEAIGLAYGVGACGTSRYNGQVGTLGVVGDGDVAACDIGNHFGNEEGRDATHAVLHEVGVLALEGLYAADTAADGNAESARVDVLTHFETAVVHGLVGCGESVEGVDVVVTDHGLLDAVVLGMEVLDFGGDFDGQVGVVDFSDEIDAAFAVDNAVPQCVDVVSEGGDAPHAGDVYSAHILYLFSLFILVNTSV